MTADPRAIELLAPLPGMEGAPADALRRLAASFRPRRVRRGETLCAEGQPADRVLLLVEGLVSIEKRDAYGRDWRIATLTPGSLFGHASALSLDRSTATARADAPCLVLEMPAERARTLLREGETPAAAALRRALLAALARQLDAALRTAAALAVRVGEPEVAEAEGRPAA